MDPGRPAWLLPLPLASVAPDWFWGECKPREDDAPDVDAANVDTDPDYAPGSVIKNLLNIKPLKPCVLNMNKDLFALLNAPSASASSTDLASIVGAATPGLKKCLKRSASSAGLGEAGIGEWDRVD